MDKLDKWPVMNADDVIESLIERSKAAATLGKLGGKVKSEAKAEAARENGKLGGRPRKPGPS